MTAIDTPVVLIVEDDPPVRALLRDVLEDEGYEVVAVHDGTVALQVIETLKIDLMILDLDLPGLTGVDLLEVLHRRKAHLPPVLIVTSTKPVRRKVQQMVQSVITKQFDIDEFLQAVVSLLPRQAHKAQTGQRDGRRQEETMLETTGQPQRVEDVLPLRRSARGQDEAFLL